MFSRAPGLVSLLVSLLLAFATTASATGSLAPGLPSATLDDLLAEDGVADVAVSPSGRYLAIVVRKGLTDRLAVMDLHTGEHQVITTVGRKDVGQRFDARMSTAYWKTDERLLFRLEILPADGVEWKDLRFGGFRRLGTRLFAIDRNGKNRVRMLGENNNFALDLAFDLGTIRSMLPRDPEHILMVIDGEIGRSLFKVNVTTGKGDVVERPNKAAWDWWLDLDGRAIVRVEASLGTLRFFRRESSGDWKQFYSARRRELEKERVEYDWLGASDEPNKMYVLSRPPGAQRFGIYLYDLAKESFGKPVAEHSQYDIFAGTISRDGTKVLRYCYVAHVRICESADAKVNAHMKGVRKFFKDSANVYVVDSSQDNQTLLLYVEGPSDAPAYYEYRLSQKKLEFIGHENTALEDKRMPSAELLQYSARDGKKVHGYLTRPPGGETAKLLPLVVMPHGGPESRDFLAFDVYVQSLAAQGYALFQPNFRGSEGFGLEYIESGYGRWGREMQDDITDGVNALIAQGIADPQRICIVGASYGGYAALAGATLTPELYRCVVSIAGVTDLAATLRAERNRYGAKSETYEYWVKQIGDPERDADRIAAVSPVQLVARIRAPILLVHGEDDDVVPISQSEVMKKALDRSGRRTELIVLEDEGHSYWKLANLRKVLGAVQKFVSAEIGPGHVSRPEE